MLRWARKLQAVGQSGLTYATSPYEQARFQKIRFFYCSPALFFALRAKTRGDWHIFEPTLIAFLECVLNPSVQLPSIERLSRSA
ncbi:MAG: NUDIX hydrolase N-terminal domain-containing protein [Planctomycetes bacterium]|nr:NUDIX hydrolase N-terminal domain-containing protein [Planctomycetota bacterium]